VSPSVVSCRRSAFSAAASVDTRHTHAPANLNRGKPSGHRQETTELYRTNNTSSKYTTEWAKKLHTVFIAITLSTLNQFSYFLAHIHYRKFATGRCIVSPPNAVCVTTLPWKIVTDFIHVHLFSLFQKCYPFTLVIIAIFQIFINRVQQ